jgi:catechol 2,3-dioxygenase-like lactoylglutathione lyase family enzyme
MKPRITVITIGVDDLERSLRFYRDGLALRTEGIIGEEFEYGSVAFFDLEAGLKLAIFPRESISRDSTVPEGPRARRSSRSGTTYPPGTRSTWSCGKPEKRGRPS